MNPNGLSATHTTNPYSTLKPSLECFTFPNVLERWVKKLRENNEFLHAELHVVKPEEAAITDASDITFYVDIRAKSPLHTGGMSRHATQKASIHQSASMLHQKILCA